MQYMLSKSLTCAFAMACMCVTYLLGSVLAGLIVGASMDVKVGSLLVALLERFECVIERPGGASIDQCKYWSISLFAPFSARRKCKRIISISAGKRLLS